MKKSKTPARRGKARPRPTPELLSGEYAAVHDGNIGGTYYKRGERVDVSALAIDKIDQLLDHRFIVEAEA